VFHGERDKWRLVDLAERMRAISTRADEIHAELPMLRAGSGKRQQLHRELERIDGEKTRIRTEVARIELDN